jgi:SHS2 domain-containing protein
VSIQIQTEVKRTVTPARFFLGNDWILSSAKRTAWIFPGYNRKGESEKEVSMPRGKYQTFEHTADLGIRVFGRTEKELFANAAYALFDLMADLKEVQATESLAVRLEAADREDLLVRWLSELLSLASARGFLFKEFSFSRLDATSLDAVARGETFDPSRHKMKMEIKAVTYHQVEIKEKEGRWEGKVIFDV